MADIRRFVARAERKMTDAVRKIAIACFTEVILRSPVDTGRFRGNWQVAIGTVPAGTLELDDTTGAATMSKVEVAAMGLRHGDVIHLVNNLPYGPQLEAGSSSQAPAGMVRLTAQRFPAIAEAVVKEIGPR